MNVLYILYTYPYNVTKIHIGYRDRFSRRILQMHNASKVHWEKRFDWIKENNLFERLSLI